MRGLADARAERDGARERDPAADRVDHRGAGEVVEAELFKPALRRLAREAAPHPVSAHGIHDRADDHRVDEVALELDAFRHRARDDGRGRGGEHGLEEEERPVPRALAVGERWHAESAPAEPAGRLRGAEHERGAEDVECERARGEVHQVLHHDVRRVLGPREAGLHEGEAGLHREHENSGDERPDHVQVGLDFRCCNCCWFHCFSPK